MHEGEFVCIDETSGQTVFSTTHPELRSCYRVKRGAVFSNRIAFCAESGHLVVLRTDDGSLVRVLEDRSPLWRCILVDNRLAVGTGDGELIIFDESVWTS
jgi:outer membrane protein assembly factor BamB